MTDQEKFPGPHALTQSPNKQSREMEPRISSVRNGDGVEIEPGGISKNAYLRIRGEAEPGQTVELVDGAFFLERAIANEDGHFEFHVTKQKRGEHYYKVLAANGTESETWVVFMDVAAARILWVTGPDGVPIEDGSLTRFNALSFVGEGEPSTQIELWDNDELLQTLNVDPSGHWSAFVEYVAPGNHAFTAVERNGDASLPHHIRVVAVELTLQFIYGESFRLIGNHETTSDTSVTIVGTAGFKAKGHIVDYDGELAPFEADENGIFTVRLRNLQPKVHTFRAKSGDQLSPTLVIRVVSPTQR